MTAHRTHLDYWDSPVQRDVPDHHALYVRWVCSGCARIGTAIPRSQPGAIRTARLSGRDHEREEGARQR